MSCRTAQVLSRRSDVLAHALSARIVHACAELPVLFILGAGDPYTIEPNDPPARILLPLLDGRHAGPLERAQIADADGIISTSEREASLAMRLAPQALQIYVQLSAEGPLNPASPLDQLEVAFELGRRPHLATLLPPARGADAALLALEQACVRCATKLTG